MDAFGAFEAKNKLSALLDRVEKGEEIMITRHGRPIARLVPAVGGTDRNDAQAALEQIRNRVSQAGGFDWEILKAERDADRP